MATRDAILNARSFADIKALGGVPIKEIELPKKPQVKTAPTGTFEPCPCGQLNCQKQVFVPHEDLALYRQVVEACRYLHNIFGEWVYHSTPATVRRVQVDDQMAILVWENHFIVAKPGTSGGGFAHREKNAKRVGSGRQVKFDRAGGFAYVRIGKGRWYRIPLNK